MKDLIIGLKNNCERAFNFLFKQIEEASDVVWIAKSGKIIYWQHIYHAFACVEFFISPNSEIKDFGPGTVDIAMFNDYPDNPISKDAIREYGLRKKDEAYVWIDGLDDADLAKKHEGNSKRRNMDISNIMVISGLTGHLMYHVGCNDSILRENGFPGVF